MGIFNRRRRAAPKKRGIIIGTNSADFKDLTCSGYTVLAHNPEVVTAVNTIARLVGSMTIHLMRNAKNGNVRVDNNLSRLVDINPNGYMTRSNFIQWIVNTMLLDGRGNAVVCPITTDGKITELRPVPAAMAAFENTSPSSYLITIDGITYAPADVLHFVVNPENYYPWKGTGFQISLSAVADNLKQASATMNGFMKSKWKPSLIIKADAAVDGFSDKDKRRKILEDYINTTEAGEPWIIPAEQMSVQEVRPLTLSDLALADFVELDKRTVATILGVPPFVLGVGEFKREAWNNFISTTIMPLAENIQQELTKKLVLDENEFFRFNARSLYNYDLRDLSQIAGEQFVRGLMTGNECRSWLGLEPKDGLDELVILENYIPLNKIGDQNKLQGGD